MLFALGLDDEVTGVTHECDYPPQAASKPRVTFSHIDSSRSSGEIDRQVTERFREGMEIYGVDQERLRADPPDLIVTQDLCPVCAVSPSDFARHMESAGCRAEVLSLNPNRLSDIPNDVLRIGEVTSRTVEAEALVGELSARIDRVREAIGGEEERPRVLCLEWLDPPMPGGHWVPEMIRIAGGNDGGLIGAGEPSRKLPWEAMRRTEPQVIALMPCGFDAERAASEAVALWELDGWATLPAVRKGRVYALDGNSYFSRPGPRVVDGLEILAHTFHPNLIAKMPPFGSVLKLVSPPAGGSSVENWAPRFEPLIGVPL
jgi:iron complex transport system substrate-binding protein